MDANPYLPPDAALAEKAASIQEAPAFAVSTTKLVVMSFATLGLYEFYWFYKQWVAIKRRTRESISPFWRAFFSVVWCFSCFSRIHGEARKFRVDNWISVGGLASGWVILNLMGKLPDPYWLVSFLSVFCLVPIQKQANDLNAKIAPEADRNTRFTGWNIAWLVLVAIFLGLILLGNLLPDDNAGS